MKKNYFYLIGILALSFFVTGCACKHWDWTCTSCQDKTYPVQPVIIEEEAVVPPAKVVAAPVEPAPVFVPTVATVDTGSGIYDFGDYKSSLLTLKAWQAVAQNNPEAIYVYTNKCIELYAADAAKMQRELNAYPTGDTHKIFSYWALNDVATCLYIQGETYRKAKRMNEAKAAFNRIINEFSYGQTYDTGSKTFWKPAESAKDSLSMIEKGLDLNYGNMTSQVLVQRMWESMDNKNLEEVKAYDEKLESLYGQVAKDMQSSLKDYPQLPAENVHKFWALNDVGAGVFILGEAYRIADRKEEALKAYKRVVNDYFYAQVWEPQGWFWKVSEQAQQKIFEIEGIKQ